MKLTVVYERGEHHSGGSNSWTGLDAVESRGHPYLRVYHLGTSFTIDLDEIREFRVEEEKREP